jgi:hypothetical protein
VGQCPFQIVWLNSERALKIKNRCFIRTGRPSWCDSGQSHRRTITERRNGREQGCQIVYTLSAHVEVFVTNYACPCGSLRKVDDRYRSCLLYRNWPFSLKNQSRSVILRYNNGAQRVIMLRYYPAKLCSWDQIWQRQVSRFVVQLLTHSWRC